MFVSRQWRRMKAQRRATWSPLFPLVRQSCSTSCAACLIWTPKPARSKIGGGPPGIPCVTGEDLRALPTRSQRCRPWRPGYLVLRIGIAFRGHGSTKPNGQFLNEIARYSTDYRNCHMIAAFLEAVRDGKRLFVLVGGSHVIMQEPVLRRALAQD